PASAGVSDEVMALLAEQTGYPTGLLDLDLDLEADLGIDTVKQAEVFAAIRDRYGIARDDTLKLRDYPTLRHVVGFVEERTGAPAPAAAPVTAAAAAAPSTEEITEAILDVVAEQTGYPADMLDPDLDLEADLGIDTVKQAEVFAAIRERYGIDRDDTLKLRDYPTLRHVVGFVEERTGAPAPATAPVTAAASTPAAEPVTAAAPEPTAAAPEPAPMVDSPQFPRRVPVPVVRPALDVCVPTGVELGAGSRVVVMPDRGGVAEALTKRLEKLGVEVVSGDDVPDGRVDGVYWLPGLDAEPALEALTPDAWRDGLELRVKRLAKLMRELPEETFLVSATRLGGRHGYDAAGATSVMGGAITGFTKALARERAQTLIKAVDFEPSRKTAEPADRLIAETLKDPGAVEVGYADGLRWTVALIDQQATADPERALTADTTFVITGAAGSIVSAITMDLANAARGGTFHLLDLVPEPDAGDPDIARLAADRDALKLELVARMRDKGEKPTPKLVERELARIERAGAALDAIEAIEAAGGTALWHQVDLTDAQAVQEALQGIETVDVLLHCAGLEISHFLPDKPQAEYDLVFDVKALGWFHVLHALKTASIGTALGFSSIAGRFGNGGQTDYSAANDLLCKTISHFRRTGATRGITIDWTAWGGIGMATRGSIPKMMEAAGIDMLPPEIGVPAVRRELQAQGDGGEVVIAGALGILLEERHPTGGLDVDAVELPGGPMTGRVAAMTVAGGLEIRTELDPSRQGFLDHHRIDGTPVLPGVMGIEAFAETARALVPSHTVTALEDVELLSPFKFYRDEPRTLELRALIRADGDDLVADCRLVGRRTLLGGEEQETVHFTGRVRLGRNGPAAPNAEPPAAPDGTDVGHDAVYKVYFHGPAYQVLDRAYRHDGEVVGLMAGELPPNHEPAELPTIMTPRLIELCFQTAGVWEIGTEGRLALPLHVDRVVRYAGADEAGTLAAIVHPRAEGGIDAEVVDERGRVRVQLEGYRSVALPQPIEEAVLAPLRAAVTPA
ncbi:MAG TPA: SDR family NAD(P)-dependent oxidoreductase, partial [Solirubrobacteraceae bacterium]